jgi:vacuolar-type H+-ATPase subunit I/STV1
MRLVLTVRAYGLTVLPLALALVLEGRFRLLQFWWAFGGIIVIVGVVEVVRVLN